MRRTLLLAIPLALLSAACTYDNGNARRIASSGGPSADCGPIAESKIDVDRQIEVDQGQGAGVFIEYASGGHWQVRTSCDTLKTNTNCAWDIIVTPEDGRSLSNVVASDLEAGDSVLPYPDSASYQFVASTSVDLDGFTFDTDPGAGVQVDALLDDSCALQYFFWVGDGALHPGSPSNPLTLLPSAE